MLRKIIGVTGTSSLDQFSTDGVRTLTVTRSSSPRPSAMWTKVLEPESQPEEYSVPGIWLTHSSTLNNIYSLYHNFTLIVSSNVYHIESFCKLFSIFVWDNYFCGYSVSIEHKNNLQIDCFHDSHTWKKIFTYFVSLRFKKL